MLLSNPRLHAAGMLLTAFTFAGPASAQQPAASADPGLAPAIAHGQATALAWAVHDRDGSGHIQVAVPADALPITAGPRTAGDDGAPALVALKDGFLLVAARSSRTGTSLWYQRFAANAWQPSRWIVPAASDNHHPAIASGAQTWLVWVASSPRWRQETLYAARWTGSGWSAPEEIPSAPGTPMAPAIAIGPDGLPAVAWAASDGNDAEIWVSERTHAGWTPPRAVTDNDRPDITPDVAWIGGQLLVAWSTGLTDGYRPAVARRRRSIWPEPLLLSRRPGTSPKIVRAAAGPAVVWVSPRLVAGAYPNVLRAAVQSGRRWSRPLDIAPVINARIDAKTRLHDGHIDLAWFAGHHPAAYEATARVTQNGRMDGFDLRELLPAARLAPTPRVAGSSLLPGTYRGFGDSITTGLVVYNGVVSFTPGYPVPLADMISGLIGKVRTVTNSGVPGETTAEGVGRLAGLMASSPSLFVFLMEGANDVSTLVDAPTSTGNMRTMIRTIQAAGCYSIVGTLTPRNQNKFDGPMNRRVDEFNALLLPIAKIEKATLIDMHAAFDGQSKLYSDHIHPNEEGYLHMAGVWFRGIQPILQQLLQDQDADGDRVKDAALFPAPRRPIQ